jgi:hypothetical protein
VVDYAYLVATDALNVGTFDILAGDQLLIGM